MVGKRKQNRKVKREIRRKVRANKVQSQQPPIPKDQEMMVKLMAMMKGGGGLWNPIKKNFTIMVFLDRSGAKPMGRHIL